MYEDRSRFCPLCGGEKKPGLTTFTADLGTGIVVVRNVPATICGQCEEEWISPEIATKLQAIVDDARIHRRQVEVLDLSA